MIIKGVEIAPDVEFQSPKRYVVGEKCLTGGGAMAEVKVISFDGDQVNVYFDNAEINIFKGMRFMIWGTIENRQQEGKEE